MKTNLLTNENLGMISDILNNISQDHFINPVIQLEKVQKISGFSNLTELEKFIVLEYVNIESRYFFLLNFGKLVDPDLTFSGNDPRKVIMNRLQSIVTEKTGLYWVDINILSAFQEQIALEIQLETGLEIALKTKSKIELKKDLGFVSMIKNKLKIKPKYFSNFEFMLRYNDKITTYTFEYIWKEFLISGRKIKQGKTYIELELTDAEISRLKEVIDI